MKPLNISKEVILLVCITIGSFLIRFYFQFFHIFVYSDSSGYIRFAWIIAFQRQSPVGVKTFKSPFMGISLGIFLFLINLISPSFSLYFASKLFSVIIGTIIVVPTYLLGREVFNNKIGLISAFLVSINAYLIQYSIVVMTEILFSLLITCGLYFSIIAKKKNLMFLYVLCGLFLGLSYLTRPEGVLIALTVILFVNNFFQNWLEFDFRNFLKKFIKKLSDLLKNKYTWSILLPIVLLNIPYRIHSYLLYNDPYIWENRSRRSIIFNDTGIYPDMLSISTYMQYFSKLGVWTLAEHIFTGILLMVRAYLEIFTPLGFFILFLGIVISLKSQYKEKYLLFYLCLMIQLVYWIWPLHVWPYKGYALRSLTPYVPILGIFLSKGIIRIKDEVTKWSLFEKGFLKQKEMIVYFILIAICIVNLITAYDIVKNRDFGSLTDSQMAYQRVTTYLEAQNNPNVICQSPELLSKYYFAKIIPFSKDWSLQDLLRIIEDENIQFIVIDASSFDSDLQIRFYEGESGDDPVSLPKNNFRLVYHDESRIKVYEILSNSL